MYIINAQLSGTSMGKIGQGSKSPNQVVAMNFEPSGLLFITQ